MKYSKKTLLLSAVTLGLLSPYAVPNTVSASTNAVTDSETVKEEISMENGKTYHIVRSGETVYSISNKYGISQDALTTWNNISNNNIIVNQVLSVDGVNKYKNIVKESNTFATTEQFINRVAPIALEMAEKYQLYPSVMIAQGVLETGSGKSELAVLANNYYGIKGTYKGNSVYKLSPEEVKGTIIQQSSRFRVYPSLRASVEDNAKRLRLGPNTDSEAKPWNAKHYQGTWVENTKSHYDATLALRKAGYATDSKYTEKLNKIIADYNLSEYDKKIYDFIDDSITGPMEPEPKPEDKPIKVPDKEQVADSSTAFLDAALALPSTAAIEKMDDNQLTNIQKTFASVRSLYNSLTAKQKEDKTVQRWEGYLKAKEDTAKATKVALQQMSGNEFVKAVGALPNVSNIQKMDRTTLNQADKEMQRLRAAFNSMSKKDKEIATVARWAGYLKDKESAVAMRDKELLKVVGVSSSKHAQRFISTVLDMPNLTRISQMNPTQANTFNQEVKDARALFNNLTTTEKADATVRRWEGHLSTKADAVAQRLSELPALAAEEFVNYVAAMPNLTQINRMTQVNIIKLENDMKVARAQFNSLSNADKSDAKVALWGTYLSQKEAAVAQIYQDAHDFEALLRKTPNVEAVLKQNEAQRADTLKQYQAGRKAYDALSIAVKSFDNVIRWEEFLTIRENTARGMASSVILTKDIKYGVASGDTMNSIAEKFQISLDSLLKRNSSVNPTQLKRGQTLYIPRAVARPMNHAQAHDGKHVVYLDAGHGGSDSGARYSGVSEKDLNLTLARKLTSRLESMGYEVINVRTNDKGVSNLNRAREANASNGDIYISLHHNAMGRANSSVSGIETFYYKYSSSYNPKINGTYHNDGARIANSAYLSHLIQDNLISATGANYRRVDGMSFEVVRETSMPASLIEFGFMDNRQELNKLLDGSYQNKMVNAVANGIDTYFTQLYK